MHRSGWWGLEQAGDAPLAEPPDLFTFGKVVGGGMPLAAIGGRAEAMDLLAPLGPVYQAGTLSGNPLATAAGLATLALADDEVYRRVDAAAAAVQAEVGAALISAGVPHRIQAAGSLFTVFFGEFDVPIDDYATAQRQDPAAFARFFHAMLDAGVALPPSGYEAWFLPPPMTTRRSAGSSRRCPRPLGPPRDDRRRHHPGWRRAG